MEQDAAEHLAGADAGVGRKLNRWNEPTPLSSMWAIIPAMLLTLVLIVRTVLEDKTLHAELPGYTQYAERVRYRLLPFVW
jgi:protein-S-isoprenylcysteine O-methyltransferase Ste14